MKKAQWKEDLYFAIQFAWQKLSQDYAEVTPTMVMRMISSHILDPFWKLQSVRKWDKGMYIHPEDETSYTTQYKEAFLKYVENEYCAKQRHLPVIKPESILCSDLLIPATASGSGKTSVDPYDLSGNDEEHFMTKTWAEKTPGKSDRAGCYLIVARLHLNSQPQLSKNWGQVNPNHNDYHSHPM